jgi:hypothetical protein
MHFPWVLAPTYEILEMWKRTIFYLFCLIYLTNGICHFCHFIKKNMSRIRKYTFYYNFVWRPLKATKNVYSIPQKWKNKDTYGIYPTKFERSTPNQPIEKKSNKIMFSTSKVKRSQKFVWELPDGICRLNPKS